MTAQEAWKLFCATGAPEYYLMYREGEPSEKNSDET